VTELFQGKNIAHAIHVITAMPPYQNKSFEEIRLEDYTGQGKKEGTISPAPAHTHLN
jgi:hypothetical protein